MLGKKQSIRRNRTNINSIWDVSIAHTIRIEEEELISSFIHTAIALLRFYTLLEMVTSTGACVYGPHEFLVSS